VGKLAQVIASLKEQEKICLDILEELWVSFVGGIFCSF